MKQDMFYCPLPWNSISIRNNGEYRVCCYSNALQDRGVLRDKENRIESAATVGPDSLRNHPQLMEIRRDFLSGNWPVNCQRCKSEEASGMSSGRTHAIKRVDGKFSELVKMQTAESGQIDPEKFPIHEMNIRFGNKCNLSCRPCGPADSSGWYEDWFKLGNKTLKDTDNVISFAQDERGRVVAQGATFEWYENRTFESFFPANQSALARIYFVGGEPLLIKKHIDLLDYFIKNGIAGNLLLEYNTNLSVLPDNIINLWGQFKKVRLGVSMDGHGAYHEYMRYPGRAENIESNLVKLLHASDNVDFTITYTVSYLNAGHSPDFFIWFWDFESTNGPAIGRKHTISVHPVHRPRYLDLREVPDSAKTWIGGKIKAGINRINSLSGPTHDQKFRGVAALESILAFMNSKVPSQDWAGLWSQNLKLDSIRNQSYRNLEPELSDLLNSEAFK